MKTRLWNNDGNQLWFGVCSSTNPRFQLSQLSSVILPPPSTYSEHLLSLLLLHAVVCLSKMLAFIIHKIQKNPWKGKTVNHWLSWRYFDILLVYLASIEARIWLQVEQMSYRWAGADLLLWVFIEDSLLYARVWGRQNKHVDFDAQK